MKSLWLDIIEKRNRLLAGSDWTQLPDNALTDSKKAEWATYRQALRDLPNTLRDHEAYQSDETSNPIDGSIIDWKWPTKP